MRYEIDMSPGILCHHWAWIGARQMWKQSLIGAILSSLVCTTAWAHGGGGYVAVPIFIPGAAAAALPPPQTGDYSQIHTVAVISGVGQNFRFQTAASGIFGRSNTIDISDWKLDAFATSIIRRYLSTRFTVKDVAFDRGALFALPNGGWTASSESSEALRKFMTSVSTDGVDAFVVIRPDLVRSVSNNGIVGLGLQRGDLPIEWLNFEIDIIDAHTLQQIGACYARAQIREGTGPQLPGFIMPANRDVGDSLTPTPAQLSLLKTDFELGLQNTLTETLRALRLGIDLPVPGSRSLVPIPEAMNPYKAIKTVGVVSTVGDNLELPWSGMLLLHGMNAMQIRDWKLDGEIEADVTSALGKQFTVRPIAFDRARLASASVALDKNKQMLPIEGLAPSSDVDAFVVVLNDTATIGPPALSQDIAGFGVWNREGQIDKTAVFAIYAIAVVDAHTLKILAVSPGISSPRHASSKLLRKVDETVFQRDGTTISADGVKTVHAAISDIMSDSIPETLLRLGLTGVMVEKPETAVAQPALAPQSTSEPANGAVTTN
jgi:hypothetical protein